MHSLRTSVMGVAVSGQHPLELITQKFFHRPDLFGPGIPANTAKRCQCLPPRRPRQVIACEQKLISVKKYHVTTRMARCWNHEQFVIKLNGISACNHVFDAETSCTVVNMHHPLAVESFAKEVVIGDVVFVRQQHSADAAHHFDPFEQLTCESRRVDQDVAALACRARDEIAPGSKAGFGREAAKVNVVCERHRKRIDADVSVVSLRGADRTGGTRNERHHGASDLSRCFGLMINAALVAMIAKDRRRQLATRIAIDAGGIYEEIAGDIFR